MSASVVNTPRYQVTMNGAPLLGVDSVSVTVALSFQVGTFRLTKAFLPGDQFPPSWWASTSNKTMLIVISISVDGKTFTPVLTGNVDSHSWDVVTNQLNVVGRDLAALLLDKRIVTTNRNLTSSEIAQQLALEHQLTTSITPTTTLVGRYFDTNYDDTSSGNFSQAINEWDLLCRLGSQEGVIPYVSGTTLYFNPPPANPPVFVVSASRDQYGNLVSNVPGITLERHMTAARDVIVTYRSWNALDKRTYSATVRTTSKDAAQPDPNTGAAPLPSRYLFQVPNLSFAQCQARAKQMATDISQHERNAQITIASLQLLSPLSVIQVTGTDTDYDMTYYPQTITYEGSFAGFSTTVQAKFSSPLYLYDNDTGEQIGEQS